MKKGRGATMTHDYKRNGTTTLFAALNVLDGTVIGQNMQRHRHQEFIRFLNQIERSVPKGKEVHAIVDNYAAHKKDKVQEWLARHPRWTLHFTPISSSWLNAVEGFFAKLTRRRLKNGVFYTLVDLQTAINRFIKEYNQNHAKPFIWKADPDKIIAARNQWVPNVGINPLVVLYWAKTDLTCCPLTLENSDPEHPDQSKDLIGPDPRLVVWVPKSCASALNALTLATLYPKFGSAKRGGPFRESASLKVVGSGVS